MSRAQPPHLIVSLALAALAVSPAPAYADDFTPTAAEQKTVDDCLARTEKEVPLKQMSECIGIVADPCGNADDTDTASILACQDRETRIWDKHLNDWFQDARAHLDSQAGPALQAAQRAWIAFRDAKCAVSEKIYGEGSMGAVLVNDCKMTETGMRAIELRAIDREANDTVPR